MIKLKSIIFLISLFLLLSSSVSWECIKNEFRTANVGSKSTISVPLEFKTKTTLDTYMNDSKKQLDYLIRNCITINEDAYMAKIGDVKETLGSGSFGEVVKSCLGQDCVAVKKPAGFGGQFEGLKDIFQEMNNSACIRMTASKFELSFLAVIRECYIVKEEPIVNQEAMEPYLTFVMDYYPTDLKKYKEQTLVQNFEDLDQAGQIMEVGWMYSLAVSLQAMHRIRITHRDLKLGNVFISQSKRAILGDFGISSTDFFHGEDLSGTPNYIDPEIYNEVKGSNYLRGDVYSLGILFSAILDDKDANSKMNKITLAGGYNKDNTVFTPNPKSYYFPAEMEWMRGMLTLGQKRLSLKTVIQNLENEVRKNNSPEDVRNLDNTVARPSSILPNLLKNQLQMVFKTKILKDNYNSQKTSRIHTSRVTSNLQSNRPKTNFDIKSKRHIEIDDEDTKRSNPHNFKNRSESQFITPSIKPFKERIVQKIAITKTKSNHNIMSQKILQTKENILKKATTDTKFGVKEKILNNLSAGIKFGMNSNQNIINTSSVTKSKMGSEILTKNKYQTITEDKLMPIKERPSYVPQNRESKLGHLSTKNSMVFKSTHEQVLDSKQAQINRMKLIKAKYSNINRSNTGLSNYGTLNKNSKVFTTSQTPVQSNQQQSMPFLIAKNQKNKREIILDDEVEISRVANQRIEFNSDQKSLSSSHSSNMVFERVNEFNDSLDSLAGKDKLILPKKKINKFRSNMDIHNQNGGVRFNSQSSRMSSLKYLV